MTVAPAILFVRSSGLLVDEAVRLATRRRADLAVLDVDAGPACEQRSIGRRERVAARIAARVRTLDARLVVLDGGVSIHTVSRLRQELRSEACDFLLMAGPITGGGCILAAVDPARGDEANARSLGTALAHSHVLGCELHALVARSSASGSSGDDRLRTKVEPPEESGVRGDHGRRQAHQCRADGWREHDPIGASTPAARGIARTLHPAARTGSEPICGSSAPTARRRRGRCAGRRTRARHRPTPCTTTATASATSWAATGARVSGSSRPRSADVPTENERPDERVERIRLALSVRSN